MLTIPSGYAQVTTNHGLRAPLSSQEQRLVDGDECEEEVFRFRAALRSRGLTRTEAFFIDPRPPGSLPEEAYQHRGHQDETGGPLRHG